LNKISSIIKTNQKINDDDGDNIGIDLNNIQIKLDKKDPDFIIKKQKIQKKAQTNKNQVLIYYKNILLFLFAFL
jgi:hypothetical protein